MKLALPALLSLAGLAWAQLSVICPTATKTIQNRGCGKECPFTDCSFTTTIRNPCGCPTAIPTATLIAPCEAACPYQGCDIEFRTAQLTCAAPTTTSSSTRRWRPTTRRSTTTRSTTTTRTTPTATGVVTSVVTLPPIRTTTTTTPIPCPTVTRTTSPAGCSAIRCPVPTCRASSTVVVPCGCEPKTVLYVQGCATACPEGCLTRTQTTSLAC